MRRDGVAARRRGMAWVKDGTARRMRIGIDGYNLAMPRGTGVASYGIELARMLRQMGHGVEGIFGIPVPANVELRETAFFDLYRSPLKRRPGRLGLRRVERTIRSLRVPRLREVPLTDDVAKRPLVESFPVFDRLLTAPDLFALAFTRYGLTGRFVELELPQPPDVMHWTYPVPLVVKGIPNIYTLHDLVPLKLPYTTLDNKQRYQRIVATCIDRSARICTVSEASKADIVDRFGVDPDRVAVTYQTAPMWSDAEPRTADDDARAIEGVFGLRHRGYFLYYGAIEPKKNVGRLIEAYLAARLDAPLVIVGARAWKSERELSLLPNDGAEGATGTFQGPLGQTVMRLDYLSRDLLAKLVRGARAVVFPSLYEGFGLPALEAMQLGTPVIASSASSLPEIVGDAGVLVDPYNVDALRAALIRVDADADLRGAMALRGIERATLFSPARYRERLTDLYRSATAPR